MKTLTEKEQNKLIKKVFKDYSFINQGSSRKVFDIGKNRVLKIAFDNGGFNQNMLEVETYQQYNNILPLAKIYAYSKNCIIMEKVDILDSYDDFDEINDTINDYNIEDILGYTSDNQQMGRNKDGKVVMYDYGFNLNNNYDLYRDELIGDVSSFDECDIERLVIE